MLCRKLVEVVVGCARTNVLVAMACKREFHTKCRGIYAGGVERFQVPDDKVSWLIDWPEYKPVDYTAPRVQINSPRTDVDYRYEMLVLNVCICCCGKRTSVAQ